MVLHQPENKHVLKAFDLSGKVAAITGIILFSQCYWTMLTMIGGARGIGLEVSKALAEAGADVSIHHTLINER